jgi:D-aminopeptidase
VTAAAPRRRLRDLGVSIGAFEPGDDNAITDVDGVRVGHVTNVRGEGPLVPGEGPVRTGVTAVFPAGGDVFHERVFAGTHVLSGAGEVMGITQIDEWGLLETPILLTGTLSIGRVADGAVSWMRREHPRIGHDLDVVIPIVGECDDSYLNDAAGRHVSEADVMGALDAARAGPVVEGSIGAGAGMQTFDFAGGVGTSSRVLEIAGERTTLGALVLSNFGTCERLRVDGAPVGRALAARFVDVERRGPAGSIIVLLATDAPLTARQLSRLCRRGALGLGRVGGFAANASGEILLAWSTANRLPRRRVARRISIDVALDGELDPLFEASLDVVEEAVLNAICAGAGIVGHSGHRVPALPLDEVAELVRR